jgi:predicted transcriptional regulator
MPEEDAMGGRLDEPSATELEVLKALWTSGPSTIRQLADRLYPGGGTAQYATVQKLLDRLEAKRCVKRRRVDRVNVFAPSIEREELIERRLRNAARDLCEGSLTPILTHLVDSAGLSPDELRALREIVERRGRRGGTR